MVSNHSSIFIERRLVIGLEEHQKKCKMLQMKLEERNRCFMGFLNMYPDIFPTLNATTMLLFAKHYF
jgi:hypothetical protein